MKLSSTISILFLSLFSLTVHAHNVSIPKDIKQLKLTKVAADVHVLHGMQALPDKDNKGFISNSGIVISDKGVVIIDTGGSQQYGEMLLQKIRELTDKPVIAVFNTHLHGDHWFGNSAIKQDYPDVRIYAHERAIERLQGGEAEQWLDIFTQAMGEAVGTAQPVLPDVGLKGGESMMIAGNTYRTHHTGQAHTDNDIMIEFPANRLLFTGDIVIHGNVVSGARPEDFSATGQIAAIDFALALAVDTYVPGHGPSGGRDIPEATKRFLQALYASVQRYYDEGLEDFEMRDKVVADMAEFSDWSGYEGIGRLISFVYQQVQAAEFE
jgi:glyoxylase-like metal-dependent hydrolase (beta-lactamase superfamily II)